MLRVHFRSAVTLLLLGVAVARAEEAAPAAPLPKDGTYYIEAKPTYTCKLNHTEKWTVRNSGDGFFKVFAPAAPEVPGQSDLTTTLTLVEGPRLKATKIADNTIERRPMMELAMPNTTAAQLRAGVTFHVDYAGTLNTLQIHVGKPPKPIAPLSKDDRRMYLVATPTLDYNAPAFVACYKKAGLIRNREEDVTAFAARVFKAIVEHGSYETQYYSGDACRPSNTCKTLATNGPGFSLFFTAVMRSNGVPARSLFGRWTKMPPDGLEQMSHAIAEFYVPDTGWVPVDIANAVAQKPKDPMAWFGTTDGQFMTLHIDPDIEPSTGIAKVCWNELIPFWLGPASFWYSKMVRLTWREQQEAYTEPSAGASESK